ncbi:MAG: ThuA domain-containing protein, partial [Chloroflexi bacterium]|nr:ThuA domain-containing protein [Chloroflexota bacterium]
MVGGPAYHDSPEHRSLLSGFLRASGRLDVTMTDDLTVLNAADLAGYDVIVNYTTFFQPGEEQVAALLGTIEEGKGFVGIHGATATFWNAPAYLAMIGSRFLRHHPFKTFTVTVDDRSHPITTGIEDFEIQDELYEQEGNVAEFAVVAAELAKGRPSRELRHLGEGPLGPDIHVLASAEGRPLLYVKSFGKGRVHYNALGHDARAIN